jgi:hypothetical protein
MRSISAARSIANPTYARATALTNLLLPHITGRVVTLSWQAERSGCLDFDDLNWERTEYSGTRAYNSSKLANLLITSALQRRLEDAEHGPEHLAHMRGGAELIKRSRQARDPELADKLWGISARLTKIDSAR